MKKIRIGIDLDHVIRDINRQIVKCYQRDFDESIDIDDLDYKDDVIKKVCKFESSKEVKRFLYEDYPLEIFGHANQMSRNLSRDINQWLQDLTNQEEYDVDIFFFSMKEFNLTIQSSYFFLSKIGSRVRKVVFPKNIDELSSCGDVFITAYPDTAEELNKNRKGVIFIKMNFNKNGEKYANVVFNDLKEFLGDNNKLSTITNILNKNNKCQSKTKSFWTLMQSWISFFRQTKKEQLT